MKSNSIANATRAMALWATLTCCWTIISAAPAQAQTLSESVAAIDECVQKLDKTQLPTPVAQALKMEVAFVEKALLQDNCRVSDLVFIRALAEKNAVSHQTVLSSYPQRDWLGELKKAGFSEEAIQGLLDDAYADLALKMLDFPKKKENVKKTAKR